MIYGSQHYTNNNYYNNSIEVHMEGVSLTKRVTLLNTNLICVQRHLGACDSMIDFRCPRLPS